MTHSNTIEEPGAKGQETSNVQDSRSPSHILASLGMPLLLFGTSLFALLLFSFTVVLPHFTRFELNGETLSASAVSDYRDQLRADMKDAEQKRDDLLMPSHDAAYDQLRTRRAASPDPVFVRAQIRSIASATVEKSDVVSFSVVRIDTEKGTVHLEGDVHNSGPRSMTVLSQIVDALRTAPFTASLTPPLFERREEPAGVFHSPFSFDLTLRSGAAH